MEERKPLALGRPKPDETDEEFVQRFADEVMAALKPHQTRPPAGESPTGPQEPAK